MTRAALTLTGLLLLAAPAAAQEVVPVSTLLALSDEYDQQVVTVRGELVGDYGERGDITWVQLNDDAYVEAPLGRSGRLGGTNTGIGVRISGSVPDAFGEPGRHGVRGPVVEVVGVFRNLDPALGGLTFIEAVEVDLIAPAEPVAGPGVDLPALIAGAVLTVAGLLTLALRRDLLRVLSE